jgi:hypothetical protein
MLVIQKQIPVSTQSFWRYVRYWAKYSSRHDFMVPELCPLIIWGKRASLWSPCFNLSFPLSNILSLYTNVRVQEIAMGLVVLVKKMSSSLIFYCKIPILCQSLVKKTDKWTSKLTLLCFYQWCHVFDIKLTKCSASQPVCW